jgi:hypothetical protein
MTVPPGRYPVRVMTAAPEPAERPRAISVIAWLSLVLSGLLVAKALIDLVVWKAMGPAVPALLGMARDPSADAPYVRTILRYLTEIKLAQAAAWIGVACIAIGLLRLRDWARRGMQVVGGCVLLYFSGVLVAWSLAWNAPPPPGVAPLSRPARLTLLGGGITVTLVLAAIVVWMILILRRRDIREAFGASPP